MSMQTVMAADLAALWGTEMTTTCQLTRNGVTTRYTVLVDDLVDSEQDSLGGPELERMRNIHFLTTDISSIEVGEMIMLLEPTSVSGQPEERKKLVLRSITSADGNELIVTVRGA